MADWPRALPPLAWGLAALALSLLPLAWPAEIAWLGLLLAQPLWQEAWRRGVFCELGEGDVDLAAFFAELEAAGYEGWLVVEQDRIPRPGEPQLQQPPSLAPVAAGVPVEHTPVAGSTSSTLRAAAASPASHADTERTCSYPVASRKVGARP